MSNAELKLYRQSAQISYTFIGALIVGTFTFGGAWFEFRANTAELREIKETIKVLVPQVQEDRIRLQEIERQVQVLQKFAK
jgi:hypothetical protein